MTTNRITTVSNFVLFAVAVLCAVFASGPAVLDAQPPAYTVTQLGTLGGTNSSAFGINNSGQVVGSAFTDSTFPAMHATLFSGTGTGNLDLGTLGGTTSHAYAINDSGQIVGDASIVTNNNARATLFSGTGSGNSNLGNLENDFESKAYSINNSGQIVGYAGGATGIERAVLFSGTGSGNFDLGTLGGSLGTAHAINDSGQIVGIARNTSGIFHATRFSGTGSGNLDLGTLGGPSSQAFDINESSQIVGHAGTMGNGPTHAVLYSGTGSGNTDLDTLGGTTSRAYAINNSGQVVGNSAVLPSNAEIGFLYSAGTMSSLDSLLPFNADVGGVTISNIGHTINDWGQIAANGANEFGSIALRLDPVNPLTSTSSGDASRNTRFISGMNYNKFTTTINPGNLGTTVSLLGGAVGSGGAGTYGLNRNVNISFVPPNPVLPVSDIVTLTGTEGDTYVLQYSYDESAANSLLDGEANARLGWLNGGDWVLAVDGNSDGTPTFVSGAWNAGYTLGFHGVDTSANIIWAVINHSSDFAAIGATAPSVLGDFNSDGDADGRDFLMWQRGGSPTPLSSGDLADWQANYGTGSLVAASTSVPEPSTWVLLSLAAVGGNLPRRRRIAKRVSKLITE